MPVIEPILEEKEPQCGNLKPLTLKRWMVTTAIWGHYCYVTCAKINLPTNPDPETSITVTRKTFKDRDKSDIPCQEPVMNYNLTHQWTDNYAITQISTRGENTFCFTLNDTTWVCFPSLQPNQQTWIQTYKQATSLWNKPNTAVACYIYYKGVLMGKKSPLYLQSYPKQFTRTCKPYTGYTDEKEKPHQTMEFIQNTTVNRETFH
jgi:hypothetical protein